mgnify:CR=1 FL=1
MGYLIAIGIGIAIMIAVRFSKEREILRVEWDKVAQFLAFMVMLTLFRTYLIDLMMYLNPDQSLPALPGEISGTKWTLGLVFWEDAFFGIPVYFLSKYVKNKWLKWPAIVAISLLFGSGHLYQGPTGMLLSLYPYFISKKYGERNGFGTVMLCHIMYDSFTAFWVVLLPYLLG